MPDKHIRTATICDNLDGFRPPGEERMDISITINTANEAERKNFETTLIQSLEKAGCRINFIPLL